MKTVLGAVLGIGLSCLGATANAQDIYRCGQTYSRVPCPNATVIPVESPPTAAQRAEGRQVALREKRLADDMARDRRRDEAAQRPALASSLGPIKAAVAAVPIKPVKKPTKKRRNAAQPDDGRDFVATVPRVRKTRG